MKGNIQEKFHSVEESLAAGRDSQPTVQDLNRLLQLQRDFLDKVACNLPLSEVLSSLCLEVEDIIPDTRAFIMLMDKYGQELNIACAPSIPESSHSDFSHLQPGRKSRSCGAAIYSDQPVFISDTQNDPRWVDHYSLLQAHNIRSSWAYPLHEAADLPIGSISIISDQPRNPTPYEARVVESAANIASIAISRHFSDENRKEVTSHLSHIASSLPGVVLQTEFKPDGQPYFTFVSEGIQKLFGVTADQAMERFDLIWEMLSLKDQEQLASYLSIAPEEAKLWTTECQITDRYGSKKWIYMASTPQWSDESSHLKRVNSIMLDITSEKEAHNQLELAGIAFKATSEGIMITDSNDIIVNVNRAYCQMTGYSKEELIGRPMETLNPNRHENLVNRIHQAIEENGLWQGDLWSRRKNGEVYPQRLIVNAVYDENGDIKHYVSVTADSTKQLETEAKLRHMAQHDSLTDLPNRDLFKILLDHAIENNEEDQRIAVLMIDLDRFKYVNETMGHQTGDQLLLQVTARLKQVLSDDQYLLARVGGDEFALMLEECSNLGNVDRMARNILTAMERPFVLSGKNLNTTASIGISIFPDHGFDGETILKNADMAVHQAKDDGRNMVASYTPEQSAYIQQWVKLEPALREALKKQQFLLYYQPQVDALTGQLSGFEALLRWQHPEEGIVPPNVFLEILEGIGLIKDVGNWVLDQACAQLAEWNRLGYDNFRVSVNLAGQQILHTGFVEYVKDTLDKYQLSPERLELEILENLIVTHADAAQPVLTRLKDMGISLALDDFGTGYSSLSYLKMLPVQKVKIDQTLVRDIPHDSNDEAIARAVIALGHSLNLSVCAEGVETEEQKIFLRRENCDQLQGYLISRPIPANDATKLLKKMTNQLY